MPLAVLVLFGNSVGAAEGFGVPKGAPKVESIVSVANEDIDRLTAKEAVIFFRDLMWAEGRRVGIGISQMNIPSRINVADGGIDATVDEHVVSATQDLIKPGRTCYQVKTGASFKPWQKAAVRKELFGKKNPCRENLGKAVRDCLDGGGTYVLVSFGHDLEDPERNKARKTLVQWFNECGFRKPKVDVLSQNQLIGFIDPFPSLALKINRIPAKDFRTHAGWSSGGEMTRDFESGPDQDKFLRDLRTELRRDGGATHIHVGGDPGIGKTRLVLEATRQPDLSPLVLYNDSPKVLLRSALLANITAQDSHVAAIL